MIFPIMMGFSFWGIVGSLVLFALGRIDNPVGVVSGGFFFLVTGGIGMWAWSREEEDHSPRKIIGLGIGYLGAAVFLVALVVEILPLLFIIGIMGIFLLSLIGYFANLIGFALKPIVVTLGEWFRWLE